MGVTRDAARTHSLTDLLSGRTRLDERRVVGTDATAGDAQALDIETGDGAREAVVLKEQVVDHVAELARVALECAEVDARLGVEAARGALQRLG